MSHLCCSARRLRPRIPRGKPRRGAHGVREHPAEDRRHRDSLRQASDDLVNPMQPLAGSLQTLNTLMNGVEVEVGRSVDRTLPANSRIVERLLLRRPLFATDGRISGFRRMVGSRRPPVLRRRMIYRARPLIWHLFEPELSGIGRIHIGNRDRLAVLVEERLPDVRLR